MELKCTVDETGADGFGFEWNIYKELRYVARSAANLRVAGADDANAVEPTECAIHFETKIGDGDCGNVFEEINEGMADVIGELEDGFFVPAIGDLFEVLWRKFSLDPIFERKIQEGGFVGFAMTKDCLGFSRVVIAVVAEEDDLAADFGSKAAGSPDFGGEKAFRKESARLLAEANDGWWTHGEMAVGAEPE